MHMHVGCNENGEMDKNTEESKILKLEWFMGSLVHLENTLGLQYVNTWLNMVDNFIDN